MCSSKGRYYCVSCKVLHQGFCKNTEVHDKSEPETQKTRVCLDCAKSSKSSATPQRRSKRKKNGVGDDDSGSNTADEDKDKRTTATKKKTKKSAPSTAPLQLPTEGDSDVGVKIACRQVSIPNSYDIVCYYGAPYQLADGCQFDSMQPGSSGCNIHGISPLHRRHVRLCLSRLRFLTAPPRILRAANTFVHEVCLLSPKTSNEYLDSALRLKQPAKLIFLSIAGEKSLLSDSPAINDRLSKIVYALSQVSSLHAEGTIVLYVPGPSSIHAYRLHGKGALFSICERVVLLHQYNVADVYFAVSQPKFAKLFWC